MPALPQPRIGTVVLVSGHGRILKCGTTASGLSQGDCLQAPVWKNFSVPTKGDGGKSGFDQYSKKDIGCHNRWDSTSYTSYWRVRWFTIDAREGSSIAVFAKQNHVTAPAPLEKPKRLELHLTAMMTNASPHHRLRIRAWMRQHKHELDGSMADEELLRLPPAGRSYDVQETDNAPLLNQRRPRCRSAESISSPFQLDNESKSLRNETRTLVLPSPFGLMRGGGGGIRNPTPRHLPPPVRTDEHDNDKDDGSQHDPSMSDTATDPSLSSSIERRHAWDQRHSSSGIARAPRRLWVRVTGIGAPRSTLAPSSSSPLPPRAAASSDLKSIKGSASSRLSTTSSFRFSPPRLLDEDRCLSPTQPHYLHVEDSAALSLSYSLMGRARHMAIGMVHQFGWWGIVLAALTLLEGPVVATTLLFALPVIAATLSVFRRGTARQGRRASVLSPLKSIGFS
jgi:hypothetical protein